MTGGMAYRFHIAEVIIASAFQYDLHEQYGVCSMQHVYCLSFEVRDSKVQVAELLTSALLGLFVLRIAGGRRYTNNSSQPLGRNKTDVQSKGVCHNKG